MFRFREVEKHLDEAVVEKKEDENYKKIEPKYEMTFEEAEDFWKKEFGNLFKD